MNSFYPSEIIPNGKPNRFNRDSQDRKKSAWYVCFRNHTNSGEEFFVCVYADWRDQVKYHFVSGHSSTSEDKKKIEKQIRQASEKIEKDILKKQEEAAIDAEDQFNSFFENGSSEYLKRKLLNHIPGIKYGQGFIAVPIFDTAGKLWGYQEIRDEKINNRDKNFRTGSRIKGNFFKINGSDQVVLCEGFATAASIHLATNFTVVCSFSANNLPNVANHFAGQNLIIAADNDESGVGLEWANKAALISSKFKVVLPEPGSGNDFNDIHVNHGLEAVKKYFKIDDKKEIITIDENLAFNGQYIHVTDKLKPKATIENLRELLSRLGIIVRYNVIKKDLEILIPGKSFSVENKLEAAYNHIVSYCERLGMAHSNLQGYLLTLGDENLFNPAATWITSKPWDGVSRLDSFYKTVVAKDELKNGEILCMKETLIKTWLISAVAAAFEPRGVSAHGVLVFQGPQYIGKTAWIKSLAPPESELIKDSVILKPEVKDSVYTAISHWIVELGELDATFRKSDIAQLKGFLTSDRDLQRRPFGKSESKYPRRTVYFGSVNEENFLKDPTGNRRFWVIQCESVDYAHGLDMQQIWAEVKERFYDKGHPWVLSSELVTSLNDHNTRFEEMSVISERILDRFDVEKPIWQFDSAGNKTGTWMTATEVCIFVGIHNPTQHDVRCAADCLKKFFGENFRRTKTSRQFLMPVYLGSAHKNVPSHIYSN